MMRDEKVSASPARVTGGRVHVACMLWVYRGRRSRIGVFSSTRRVVDASSFCLVAAPLLKIPLRAHPLRFRIGTSITYKTARDPLAGAAAALDARFQQ